MNLLEAIDREFDITPKEVYAQEFSVYSALEFTLFIPLWEIMPHLERILAATGYKTFDVYSGNTTFFLS